MSEAQLELAAEILGPLLDDVVFVGGATIHLWLTDPGAPPVRATDDVDVICDAVTYAQYQLIADRLRERGLQEDTSSRVICRWRHGATGLAIDVMPVSEEVLGFSNPWYEQGIQTAAVVTLPSGTIIRAMTPPLTAATKLAAWLGRGAADILTSIDVHDIVVLADGRAELAEELAMQGADLQDYVARELNALRSQQYFDYVVQSAVGAYGSLARERADIVHERIETIIARLETG